LQIFVSFVISGHRDEFEIARSKTEADIRSRAALLSTEIDVHDSAMLAGRQQLAQDHQQHIELHDQIETQHNAAVDRVCSDGRSQCSGLEGQHAAALHEGHVREQIHF